MDRTLVMIKPDCVYRRMVGTVVSAIESRGLNILNIKQVVLNKHEAEDLYKEHKNKWHFDRNINHITSGPVVLLEVEGQDAAMECRNFVEKFRESHQDVVEVPRNLLHASDDGSKAIHELHAVNMFTPLSFAEAV